MAKKEGKKVSKGERRSVSKAITKAMKRNQTELDKMMNCLEAYQKGKKVKRYGFDNWPDYRFNSYRMKNSG